MILLLRFRKLYWCFYFVLILVSILLFHLKNGRLRGRELLSLPVPVHILGLLVLRSNVLDYLLPEREIWPDVFICEFIFGAFRLLFTLLVVHRISIWVPEVVDLLVDLKGIIVFVGKVFAFELLLVHFVKHMRKDLNIEILFAVQLKKLLAVSVKKANKNVHFTQNW